MMAWVLVGLLACVVLVQWVAMRVYRQSRDIAREDEQRWRALVKRLQAKPDAARAEVWAVVESTVCDWEDTHNVRAALREARLNMEVCSPWERDASKTIKQDVPMKRCPYQSCRQCGICGCAKTFTGMSTYGGCKEDQCPSRWWSRLRDRVRRVVFGPFLPPWWPQGES